MKFLKIDFRALEQINSLIKKDIYEDAYKQQEKKPVRYRSWKKAEGIESVLYLCSECKQIHSLKSKWSHFYCKNCNATAKFTEYGYIEGDFKFKTITEWDKWQQNELIEIIKNNDGSLILRDIETKLVIFTSNHKAKTVDFGCLKMYKDKLTVGNTEILFSDILDMSIVFRKMLLVIVKGNKNYEITSKKISFARSYFTAYNYIKNTGD